MSYQLRVAMMAAVMAVAVGAKVQAQARSAPEWTTQGADAQRTSWIGADPFARKFYGGEIGHGSYTDVYGFVAARYFDSRRQ